LDTSLEDYQAALRNLENEQYRAANNRAYYCIFHSMRAVLALENKDFKQHSAVIGYFRQNYIKTEVFSKELSDFIKNAAYIRNQSDYDDSTSQINRKLPK
jgi:uncharacterized protein (UPF0332 family)